MNSLLGILTLFILSVDAAELLLMKNQVPLSFERAIRAAQQNDPWLTGNVYKQRSIEALSTAVNTLPDPKISIGLANLPTDGFNFTQEGMTQAKVGISQMFPRGDTLAIKSQQLKIQSEAFPYQRKNRKAKVAVTVGTLWLDVYRIQQSIALIEKNRALFEQLVDVAEASYSSALGKTRQQDLVRSQLELTRLDDRLDKLAQQKNRYEGMLSQWLINLETDNKLESDTALIADFYFYNILLSQKMPQIELLNTDLVNAKNRLHPQKLVSYFTQHPSVIAIDKKVTSTKVGIKLAKQKYRPEWGVSASYGHRGDDVMARSRADLFSVGVSFDLPLFTQNRQDKEVQSAIAKTEVIKAEKSLLIRKLLGMYSSAKGRLLRLKDRQKLYKSKLLPQIHDQAEASLTAYTNDDGDFSEVVRARIAVLNAEIDGLTIDVEEQKIHLELNYLFLGSVNGNIQTANNENKTSFINSNQYLAISGEK